MMFEKRLTGKMAAHFFLVVLLFWVVGLSVLLPPLLRSMDAPSPDLPFGFFRLPNRSIYTQDFAYNLTFLRAIARGYAGHPYRMADQELMVRAMAPGTASGMTHAYSPVALVLASPLLALPGSMAYAVYLAACSAGIVVLYRFVLLPRVTHALQFVALSVCTVSFAFIITYELGQSAILTTPLLGLLWFCLRREGSRALRVDAAIGLLFWAICLKPSVAIVPLMVLLGAGAWRALAVGALLLGLTWLLVGSFYGGWRDGLVDYVQLLNHYNNADFTPFFRRSYVPGHDAEIRGWFAFQRTAVLLGGIALLVARWRGMLSISEHFCAMIMLFLIFSPYLLPSEDLIICLLVVESRFFHTGGHAALLFKLLLLAALLNLRPGLTWPLPWPVEYPIKCALGLWMLGEWVRRRLGDVVSRPSRLTAERC